jgi:hypothetical protein
MEIRQAEPLGHYQLLIFVEIFYVIPGVVRVNGTRPVKFRDCYSSVTVLCSPDAVVPHYDGF